MELPILLAVPNVSEGRDGATIAAIGAAFAGRKGGFGGSGREATSGVRVMDVHSDPDHHRAVFTLAGPQGAIADPLLGGARVAIELIDVVGGRAGGRMEAPGQHPRVGALDVAPVVYLDDAARGAACAEALVVADRIGAAEPAIRQAADRAKFLLARSIETRRTRVAPGS